MKNAIYKCVSKVCAVSLTLLGFTAPITLASCYGPMPEKYNTYEELVDSDSISVADEDSLALDEELQVTDEVELEDEGEE
ncbi:MAG: hypothetical protein J5616_07310 [Bacteroidaceae bacterium]|nr:hypothetical protein [Bacteroidaceae bacterium]